MPATHYILLIASWLLFGVGHSFLAGSRLHAVFGRWSRLAYNLIAVVMTAVPLAVLANYPATPLWHEPNWLQPVRLVICCAVGLGFLHTLKFYSVTGFLGFKEEVWPLTFSPWHCWVRHPWYFLMLIFIWTQPMTDTWLMSALCISLYLIVGSRKEEGRILAHHPSTYSQYKKIVPGLIPWRGRALDKNTRERLETLALKVQQESLHIHD